MFNRDRKRKGGKRKGGKKEEREGKKGRCIFYHNLFGFPSFIFFNLGKKKKEGGRGGGGVRVKKIR